MQFRIERPSGHVIKRFSGTLEQADKKLKRQADRRGGFLQLFDDASDDEIQSYGNVDEREFTVDYVMANGRQIFKRGTACDMRSKTRTDVHVLVNVKGGINGLWTLFTLPRGDFYKTTKRIKEPRF